MHNKSSLSSSPPKHGVVLLMVLGILALMSVLAIAFVDLSKLERSITRNYVDHTRANMAAESGLEYALSRINNFDGGSMRHEELQAMLFNAGNYNTSITDYAAIPSFATVEDERFSGFVGSSYGENSDRFRLKVSDESGKLNLNDSNGLWQDSGSSATQGLNGSAPIGTGSKGRLSSLLQQLGDSLFGPGVGAEIETVLLNEDTPHSRSNLPGGRFNTLEQVRSQLLDTDVLTETQYQTFVHHITLWSWQDPNTLRPGFEQDGNSSDLYIYRDFQNNHFELEPRSPININTASMELITALLGEIRGWFILEGPGERASHGRYGNWQYVQLDYTETDETVTGGVPLLAYSWAFGKNNLFGEMRITPAVSNPQDLAKSIWQRIHSEEMPFQTWEEFEYYLREEVDVEMIMPVDHYASYFSNVGRSNDLSGIYDSGSDNFKLDWSNPGNPEQWWTDYMYDVHIDALLANFNPNTQSSEYTPNKTIHRQVDKAHLTRYTTELCFEPTGVFMVESLGEITGPDSTVVAQTDLLTVVKLWETYRQTTQAQFMGREELPVAEVDTLSDHYEPSPSNVTAQADLLYSGYNGSTVQTYPEALRKDDVSFFSPFDGSIMLATWQWENDLATFHHHYNGSLQPANGLTGIYLTGVEEDAAIDRNLPTTNRLMNTEDTSWFPGNLYPDGAYSEIGRTISFDMNNIGNATGEMGSLQFWVKPNYDPAITNRVHRVVTLHSEPDPNEERTPYRLNEGEVMSYNWQFTMNYFCHDFLESADYPTNAYFNPAEEAMSMQAKRWGSEDENHSWNFPGELQLKGWVPTRSLIVGWGGINDVEDGYDYGDDYDWGTFGEPHFADTWWIENVYGRWTNTANHNFPGHNDTVAHQQGFNLEGHCWNSIAFSWNIRLGMEQNSYIIGEMFDSGGDAKDYYVSPPPGQKLNVVVNGESIPNTPNQFRGANFGDHAGAAPFNLHKFSPTDVSRYVRMGEVSYYQDGQRMLENYSADAVYDDITSSSTIVTESQLGQAWKDGRYYNDDMDAAMFTSARINLLKELNIERGNQIRLRSCSWTLYWPKNNRKGNALAANFPGIDVNQADGETLRDDPMAKIWNPYGAERWDPISVDFKISTPQEEGPWWFTDTARSLDDAKLFMPGAAGGNNMRHLIHSARDAGMKLENSFLSIEDADEFQYRIHFNYDTSKNMSFYEVPVFDDITFTFSLRSPKIISYQIIQRP